MLLSVNRYPVTVIFCMIWSAIAFFFIVYDISNPVRILLSIPIIIFIPGYVLINVLFPRKKTEKGIDFTERIALSLGVSIAIVPLIGIVLNYSPWGFELQAILLSLEAFILIIGSIAIIRWFRTPSSDRFILTINLSIPKDETKVDKILTTALIICIIITVSLIAYVIITPKQGERFTEFYVLGPNHLASDYPTNLSAGRNATAVLGVINHEDAFRYYSIEVWLSNQTTSYNTTTQTNETTYHNLWFMEKIDVSLPSLPIDLEGNSTKQWEYNYTFHVDRKGNYKLVFLLYTTQVYHYSKNVDYISLATEKADSEHTTAYRNLYLWINVQ
jgi:uncharacterized membrane protein